MVASHIGPQLSCRLLSSVTLSSQSLYEEKMGSSRRAAWRQPTVSSALSERGSVSTLLGGAWVAAPGRELAERGDPGSAGAWSPERCWVPRGQGSLGSVLTAASRWGGVVGAQPWGPLLPRVSAHACLLLQTPRGPRGDGDRGRRGQLRVQEQLPGEPRKCASWRRPVVAGRAARWRSVPPAELLPAAVGLRRFRGRGSSPLSWSRQMPAGLRQVSRRPASVWEGTARLQSSSS